MTSKFRRTLSMEDLVNASDEEMDNLLSLDKNKNGEVTHHHGPQHDHLTNVSSDTAIVDLGEHYHEVDHFLNSESSSAPVLHLSDGDGIETKSLPRSKSVRFQEPEDNYRSLDDDKYQRVRNQVEEVKGVMKDNVSRLLDREAQLDSLSERSEQMSYSSDIYRQSSEMLRRKMWWRQVRTRLFLSAIGVICVFLILIPVITKFV
ncbi:unnamed protein product [Allacma fusca]|uniref:V-SNARE coiled-coil homology domain-containing protein n=1 Tax=Allacma fusca TaxID=39272 RepID=A0A8J2NPU6_9HEXA|nr:unnamed protein product [Allacma fusca]